MALSWSGPRSRHNGRGHEIQAATPPSIPFITLDLQARAQALEYFLSELSFLNFLPSSKWVQPGSEGRGQTGAGWVGGGLQAGEPSSLSGWGGSLTPCLRLQGPLLLHHWQS